MSKVGKKRAYQKFKKEYAQQFPVSTSSLGDYHAFCTVCSVDFNISHGGINDIQKHIKSNKHQDQSKVRANTLPISKFFPSNSGDHNVIQAETQFTEFIIEHNLPLAVADHASRLFRKMFPDSDIAKKYGCGRTKTSYIVETLAMDTKQNIVEVLRTHPFSMSTDGSTDYEDVKLYPICVRFCDPSTGKVKSVIFSLEECDKPSTGENIFKILEKELDKHEIPWKNVVCFSADNASVMLGKVKGVAAYLQRRAPSVFIAGCPCHLMHLAAGKAAKQLPVQVDELLIDIFYFLEKSSKRKQKFKSFQRKAGVPEHKIVKHVSTRWLSLGHCIERLLEQWDALLAFFEEEDKKNMPTPTCTSSLKRSRSDCTVNSPPKKQKTGGLPSSSQSVLKTVAKVASSKTIGQTAAKVASSKTVGQTAAKVASSKTFGQTAAKVASSKTVVQTAAEVASSKTVVQTAAEVASSKTVVQTAAEVRSSKTVVQTAAEVASSKTVGQTAAKVASSKTVVQKAAKVASSKTVGQTAAKVASSKTVLQTPSSKVLSSKTVPPTPSSKVASSKTVPCTPSSKTPSSKPGSFSKSLMNVVPGTGKRPSVLKTGTHPSSSKTGVSSAGKSLGAALKSGNVTLPKKKTVGSKQSNYASTKSHKVYTTMKDPNYKLYCLFMKKTIPIFEEANVLLQRDEPCIHLLHDVMCGQLRRLLVRFVKPEVVASVPESKVYEVDFHSEANLKSDDDLFIGHQPRQFIQENRDCDVELFYRSVRQYYVAACEYMIKSYPFKDPVLVNAEIINVAKRAISLSQWMFFVEKFPECMSAEEKEAVEEELCNFQADRLTEDILQPDVRIDEVWHSISKLTSLADGKPKYPSLCKIAELVIVMYHSNADCERIFSIVNKNKTEFRSSLSTRMVGNLMVRRMELLATNTPCHAVTHSTDLLQKAKSAATRGLAGASSQQ
ncbi:uncharacterized protein [Diadema setosum]|uniref:uncharacterized protein n=1 Tax=Diadema setosum TaxID=31175 RepID=UPI003B3ADC1E